MASDSHSDGECDIIPGSLGSKIQLLQQVETEICLESLGILSCLSGVWLGRQGSQRKARESGVTQRPRIATAPEHVRMVVGNVSRVVDSSNVGI